MSDAQTALLKTQTAVLDTEMATKRKRCENDGMWHAKVSIGPVSVEHVLGDIKQFFCKKISLIDEIFVDRSQTVQTC